MSEENIKKGIEILGKVGSYSGVGVETGTFSGNNSSTISFSHNLGRVPKMVTFSVTPSQGSSFTGIVWGHYANIDSGSATYGFWRNVSGTSGNTTTFTVTFTNNKVTITAKDTAIKFRTNYTYSYLLA